LVSPVTVLECVIAPVVVNVSAIEAYVVPAVMEYLQVAASFVARDTVAWVVPAKRVAVD
jgi:hypothetical protein